MSDPRASHETFVSAPNSPVNSPDIDKDLPEQPSFAITASMTTASMTEETPTGTSLDVTRSPSQTGGHLTPVPETASLTTVRPAEVPSRDSFFVATTAGPSTGQDSAQSSTSVNVSERERRQRQRNSDGSGSGTGTGTGNGNGNGADPTRPTGNPQQTTPPPPDRPSVLSRQQTVSGAPRASRLSIQTPDPQLIRPARYSAFASPDRERTFAFDRAERGMSAPPGGAGVYEEQQHMGFDGSTGNGAGNGYSARNAALRSRDRGLDSAGVGNGHGVGSRDVIEGLPREGGVGVASLHGMPPLSRRGSAYHPPTPLDYFVPVREGRAVARESVEGPLNLAKRLKPTLETARAQKDLYARKSQMTSYALNIAIGLQVIAGSLITGLSAALAGRQSQIATALLGGFSTIVASYLARARGSGEPELSTARVKDLEKFIRDLEAFQMDHGEKVGNEWDPQLQSYREQLEELLGNGDEQRKLAPTVGA